MSDALEGWTISSSFSSSCVVGGGNLSVSSVTLIATLSSAISM